MPNTFTRIPIQTVFTVQDALPSSAKNSRKTCRYITAIVQNVGHKLLAINGLPDHVQVFLGMRPMHSLSDLMQLIKGDSSRWINAQQTLHPVH